MKMLLIDANSIINRAFYGVRPLTNKEGLPTNALYGFLNILLKLYEQYNPDCVVAAFDLKAPTFRHNMYKEYKATRKGMPEDLAKQMPYLKQMLDAMNVLRLELAGYEADDIIGTISAHCKRDNVDCIIATGDRDDLQLVDKNVSVALTVTRGMESTTNLYDENKVIETLGVKPFQLTDVKALMGDSSDNVPGVTGIGEKTAYALIQKYQSLDNLYNNLNDSEIKEKVREKLINDKEMAYLSYKLCQIDNNVPIEFSFEKAKREPYNEKEFFELLKFLNFNSLIERLNLHNTKTAKATVTDSLELIETNEKTFIELFEDNKMYFLFEDNIICSEKNNKIYSYNLEKGIGNELKKLFEDEKVKKFTYNAKSIYLYLFNKGIDLNGLEFDCEIAGYLLNPSSSTYFLSQICEDELGINHKEDYNYASVLKLLSEKLTKKLEKEDLISLYNEIELPLIKVLASMEFIGFEVDKNELVAYGKKLDVTLAKLTEDIYEMAGKSFNINSPKQLGDVLFIDLGLPVFKKTKSGFSTNADVLEKLRPHHKIIEKIFDYRQLAKLKSTYVEGLLKVIGEDGRIHSSFLQTVTQTGRISSIEPNLQNIPVKKELGRELRKMFVAKNKCYLVDGDYSQIELRVLADIANDETMIDAFLHDEDIHAKTASEVFGVHQQMVTPLMRNRAKAVNFGIVYGIGEYSLSEDLNISRKEARTYINGYLETYQGVKEYMDKIVAKAKEDGFVTTIYGRKRYIPELKVSNKMVNAFGERIARNTPIQGAAADIIKIAMVKVFNRLKEEKLNANLILQIHDELIVECPKDEVEKVEKIMKEEMENAATLKVPIIAEVSSGASWYLAKN